jgi:hypothetical protein
MLGSHRTRFVGSLRFAEAGAAAEFAGFLVVLMGAKFFLHAAALQELFEAAQRQADRFLVMNPHTQGHSFSVLRSKNSIRKTGSDEKKSKALPFFLISCFP